jgi:hypothetical protein
MIHFFRGEREGSSRPAARRSGAPLGRAELRTGPADPTTPVRPQSGPSQSPLWGEGGRWLSARKRTFRTSPVWLAEVASAGDRGRVLIHGANLGDDEYVHRSPLPDERDRNPPPDKVAGKHATDVVAHKIGTAFRAVGGVKF